MSGPPALRDLANPEGLPDLSCYNQVKVRQGNAMAKKSIRGLTKVEENGRFGSLEHPWGSYMWCLPDAQPLYGGFGQPSRTAASWASAKSGRPSFTTQLLHGPNCPGHDWLKPYTAQGRVRARPVPMYLSTLVGRTLVPVERGEEFQRSSSSLPASIDSRRSTICATAWRVSRSF